MFGPNRRNATMLAIVLFTAAVSMSAQKPSAYSDDAVLARLKSRLSIDPIECGRHPLPARGAPPDRYANALTASVRCVTDAAAQRRPSWMYVHEQGIDSWGGTGLVSDTNGVVLQFYYDSDPSGGGGAASTLDLRKCAKPIVIRRSGSARLECNAPTKAR